MNVGSHGGVSLRSKMGVDETALLLQRSC